MTAQPTPRRHTLNRSLATAGLALLAVTLPSLAPAAVAQDQTKAGTKHHALSLVGQPKFGPDFKHFDWVNPAAPKGGTLRLADAPASFDSLNPYTFQGDAAPLLGLTHSSLMVGSPDEPSAEYCLICEWVSHPDDFSSVTFKLREAARFHDGKPITPDDVIFSLEAMKSANPRQALYYKNVVKAEQTGDREVTFTFDMKGNRELPVIVGQLSVLPKHYWTTKGVSGEARDVTKSTMEAPLGSGPYKIKSFVAGRDIVYERVKDHWAKDLPVSLGQYNFDEISIAMYREISPAFEAFKSGAIDYRQETSANRWNTQYDFPAAAKGMVAKELLPHKRVAGMQSFGMNLRRKQFQDSRVRRAFVLALNFEEMNKSLFYGQYTRLKSYFDNSEFASSGVPQGRELEILREVEKDLPKELFTSEYNVPSHATAQDYRRNLSEAASLLTEAGWTVKGGVLSNAAGDQLDVEFLLNQPDFERVVLPYKQDLEKLGVKVRVRIVDSSQYKRRLDTFDFDLMVFGAPQSNSPGNEQRDFWGSAAADRSGSFNMLGIKSPAIDKLIERVVFAQDRADLIAATRALDRALLWGNYVIPQWHLPAERIATWQKFGRPEKLPSHDPDPITRTWWHDAEKAKALATMKSQ